MLSFGLGAAVERGRTIGTLDQTVHVANRAASETQFLDVDLVAPITQVT